jgi:hypothetical protein
VKKIIVRRPEKSSRYIGHRGWVSSEKRAYNFSSVHTAIHFCLEHDLLNSEVVVCFGEPRAVNVAIVLPHELTTIGSTDEEWIGAVV